MLHWDSLCSFFIMCLINGGPFVDLSQHRYTVPALQRVQYDSLLKYANIAGVGLFSFSAARQQSSFVFWFNEDLASKKKKLQLFCLSSHWRSVLFSANGDNPTVFHSLLRDGPVVHVTSVSANGRAKPVSSSALSLSVSPAMNSLGPQLSSWSNNRKEQSADLLLARLKLGCSWNSSQLVIFNWYRPESLLKFKWILYLPSTMPELHQNSKQLDVWSFSNVLTN